MVYTKLGTIGTVDDDPYQQAVENTHRYNEEVAEEIRKEKEEQLRKSLEAKLGKKEAGKESIPPKPKQEPHVASEKDFLMLENIVCTDADGKVFERYNRIYVAKDVFRKGEKPCLQGSKLREGYGLLAHWKGDSGAGAERREESRVWGISHQEIVRTAYERLWERI